MSRDDDSTTPTSRKTAVQFGLRTVLASTAAIALFFGATMPVLRAWSVAERQAFGAVWVAAFVTGIGFLVGYCVLRLRAERRAGRVHFVLPQLNARRRYIAGALLCLVMLGLLIFSASVQVRQARLFDEMARQGGAVSFPQWWWSIPAGTSFGMPLAMSGAVLWWRTCRVELCESGIVYFFSFIPWSSISYQLQIQPPLLTIRVIANRFSSRLRAVVPLESFQPVREMLQANVAELTLQE